MKNIGLMATITEKEVNLRIFLIILRNIVKNGNVKCEIILN